MASDPIGMEQEDPYLWLEEVAGDAPLAWVRRQNDATVSELTAQAQFPALHRRLTGILNSNERIPYPSAHGDHYYNFWRDENHVRGIWRRTTPDQYALPEPAWDTVLDLDQLAETEQENWVWSGACHLHGDTRCLLSLSRGGGDAHVVREFDLATRAFVSDGFTLPEAKGSASWIDRDTVFVATDFGPGTMTTSGYPRIVKEWRRGTPLADARLVYEARPDDLGAGAVKDFTPGHAFQLVWRTIGFYSSELFLREGDQLSKVAKPDDASAYTVRDQLIIELRSAWTVGADTYPQGALLATDFRRFMQGERRFDVLFAPTLTSSLDGVSATRSALLLNVLDKVSNHLVELHHADGQWQRRAVDAPAFGTLDVSAVDAIDSDQYFLSVSNFLTPTTMYLCQAGSDTRVPLKSLPAFFDAAPYTVRQYEALSQDGTAVPYFVIMGSQTAPGGDTPALLYGYGGFEISLKPFYSGITGAAWLDQGGIYVLANIRGGGEFGPRWHQGALKEKRQRAYDDFIAVAEDVIARKLSSPRHLGIMGGSNGGLLVGAVMAQRPELFNAVVCQVPLLDMRRYHRLLAGASWMGEYGDPDDPAQWAYISPYSPYHNVHAGRRYPRMLLTTSTRDDRVHPGHARKMAALMQQQGHDVLYWENMEGGHAGAANNAQQAQMWALTYAFLLRQLK
ncbi:MAG: prolyl oligopeptidase family serine peptidase [Pseudomonadota bacterium]